MLSSIMYKWLGKKKYNSLTFTAGNVLQIFSQAVYSSGGVMGIVLPDLLGPRYWAKWSEDGGQL